MEEISAMPTFYYYKGGKRVAGEYRYYVYFQYDLTHYILDLVGADQTKLKSLIDTHK